ncbi:hypothetical protein V5O48_003321 [Marasmius crinis-equi]|uniref:F-box domain-containing protein n=1 Tax=Marasmius crinis-equi TaxID=585013 RepID=A0ABR3FTA6_9AGAR
MALAALPSEILHEIAHLVGNDVKNLRLVDQFVHGAVDPIMWDVHPIILDLHGEHPALTMSMLDDLSHLRTALKFRKLEIKSLDPWQWRTGEAPPDPEYKKEVIEARKRLPEILPRALSALKGLKSVRWELGWRDPEWCHSSVLESLGSLSLLDDFRVTVETNRPLPFQHLRNGSLQTLVMRIEHTLADHKQFISALRTVLVYNPHIINLQLHMSQPENEYLSFHNLFQDIPDGAVRLRSLLLSGWTVERTPRVWPRLELLHSLEFPSRWDDTHEALWKSLSSYPPQSIRHITSALVCDGLLDFLQSISGLEVLELRYAGGNTDAESDRLARRFYQDVFPRHRSTVRKLTILPSFTGMWTIGLQNMEVLDGCQRLTHLTVGLDIAELKPGANERDTVASLIPRVARLPQFSVLALTPVPSKKIRGIEYGARRLLLLQYCQRKVEESVEMAFISGVSTSRHPLRICISKTGAEKELAFVSTHDSEGSLKFHRIRVEPELSSRV